MSIVTPSICNVLDCGRPHHSNGYCDPHSKRFRLYGDPVYGGRIKIKDGRTRDHIYYRWADMIQRCYNPNEAEYKRYGGRGITVCKEWREDFLVFKRDMGDPPTPGHQLDREDNDGDYTPSNCRWSTRSINCFNRRTSRPSKTGYINVYVHRTSPAIVYSVQLKFRQQLIRVGTFADLEEAAWFADQYRLGLWGDESALNFEYA